MTFQELKEAGLIHTTRLRNLLIIGEYNDLRRKGYDREGAQWILSEKYFLSYQTIRHAVTNAKRDFGIEVVRTEREKEYYDRYFRKKRA